MSRAEPAAAEAITAPEATREQRTPSTPTPSAPAASLVFAAGGPDFTKVAGQAVKGVANISSVQSRPAPELAVRQRSVLPVFLRRSRCLRPARSPIAQPRLRRDRLGRRIRRHQQPRRRRQRARDHRGAVGQARGARADHRHRCGHRHRASEDRRAWAARHPVGRLEQATGRRMGARDRQPVPIQSDRHGWNRQRDRSRQRRVRRVRGFHSDRRRNQSRQFGRRARQHAR